jgi:Fic family protein
MGWGFDGDDSDDQAWRDTQGGLAQMDLVERILRRSLQSSAQQALTPRTILRLHRAAMREILPSAGQWRTRDVKIFGSRHVPPPHVEVDSLVQDACDEGEAIFVAAFIMWRIAWIHPFDDGNGRTARAVSYLVMSQRLGKELGGDRPVPQRIKYAPIVYTRALEAADRAWVSGTVDVSRLQRLIEFCLTAQLCNDPPTLPDLE